VVVLVVVIVAVGLLQALLSSPHSGQLLL